MQNLKWILSALAILVAAFVWHVSFLAYAMYALLLVLALAKIMTHLWLRGVDCMRWVHPTHCNISDLVRVSLTVVNRNWWPIPWLFVEETVPPKFPVQGQVMKAATLMPHGMLNFSYDIRFTRRGYHQLGPLIAESGDVFGFYKRFKTGKECEYVTVYPRVVPIMEYDIASRRPMGEIRFTNRIFEDPTRIAGIREYIAGDPLKRIHWKATARSTVLQSKIYEPSSVIGGTIILDFHQAGYQDAAGFQRSELAVVTASSLMNFIYEGNEPVGFFTNGRDAAERARKERAEQTARTRDEAHRQAESKEKLETLRPFLIPTRRSPEQAMRILDSLARTELTDGLSLGEMLMKKRSRIPKDAAMLVIAPQLTDELACVLLGLKEAGYAMTVFVVMNQQEYKRAVALLYTQHISVLHIEGEHNLSEVVTGKVYL